MGQNVLHLAWLAVFFVLLAVLSGCSAGNGFSSRKRIDLSGEWSTPLGECRLPGTTDESRLGKYGLDSAVTSRLGRLYTFEGELVYERKIRVPRSFAGKPLRLVMERTKPSTLWIDGDSIGHLSHLYAPHIYEIPSLEPGLHDIAVRIDNSGAAVPKEIQSSHAWCESTQTNWNGVLGEFYIEAMEPVRLGRISAWPSAERREVEIKINVVSDRDVREAQIQLTAMPFNLEAAGAGSAARKRASAGTVAQSFIASLARGENELAFTLALGDEAFLWSEFHPVMYRVQASLDADGIRDAGQVEFGLRDFSTAGTQFILNGFRTFLRGKHDACVFPLTGYAPMDVDSWRKVFARAKEYGINHYRCHSWTPPAAAFEAADLEGIYIQTELPLWGAIERENEELNEFLLREARMLLEEYGSHPSFMMLGLGNELHGDVTLMREWIESFRASDGRHLYCFGSNNNLGWLGPQEGEDFFVTCRVGWGEGYSSHARTSFAYVDAEKGGILNNTRPSTSGDYAGAISRSPVPVVGHETCQFQMYPDYSQIEKYKGVLYPYNLEIFRSRLEENGLSGLAGQFAEATGRFVVDCYKADMEYAFRTPGFGGFQMLDLQDYPGQGSALVGILDAFMDSKGAVEPEVFRGFCSPVVPLAVFEDYCWSTADTLHFDILLSNYLEKDLECRVEWSLEAVPAGEHCGECKHCADSRGNRCGETCGEPGGRRCGDSRNEQRGSCQCESCNEGISGVVDAFVAQGEVGKAGSVAVPWGTFCKDVPFKAVLHLKVEDCAGCGAAMELPSACVWSNSYSLWVYPDICCSYPGMTAHNGLASAFVVSCSGDVQDDSEQCTSGESPVFSGCLDGKVKKCLDEGGSVLLVPDHADIELCSVGGLFTPDYWNWSMFKTISENAGREVSPGTLSVLADPAHPALALFPNDGRSDWQWWSISRNSRPMVLDVLPKDYFPIVQVIDNIERNHKLGILFEFAVGRGKLLVCTTDFGAISGTPEGQAYIASLVGYFMSEDFSPSVEVSWEDLEMLFGNKVQDGDIQGVRNVTDYAM